MRNRPGTTAQMTVTASDHWITTENGRLFARRWTIPNSESNIDGTLLLLHDSLGCVGLWREFPQLLAATTRRSVVACDRLRFGRSDPYRGTMTQTFIRDEVQSAVPRLCQRLGLARIIPFGHSVGGGMALAMAAHCPERCATVITESALSFVEDRTISGVCEAKSRLLESGQFKRLARYHGTKARWVLDAWTETWLAP